MTGAPRDINTDPDTVLLSRIAKLEEQVQQLQRAATKVSFGVGDPNVTGPGGGAIPGTNNVMRVGFMGGGMYHLFIYNNGVWVQIS